MATGTLVLSSDYDPSGVKIAELTVTYDTVRKNLTQVTVLNNSGSTYELDVQDAQNGQTGTWQFAPHSGTTSQAVPNNRVPVQQDTDGSWFIPNWSYQFWAIN